MKLFICSFLSIQLLSSCFPFLPFNWSSCCCLVTQHVQLFLTPSTVARLLPLFMGFYRQEYWSGLPFSSPGGRPDPGNRSMSPVLGGRFFTIWAIGKPQTGLYNSQIFHSSTVSYTAAQVVAPWKMYLVMSFRHLNFFHLYFSQKENNNNNKKAETHTEKR